MEAIGQRVRALRQEKDFMQKEVTAAAKLTPSYLANLESGRIQKPAPNKVRAIVQALDATYEDLIRGTDCEQHLIEKEKKVSRVWCTNRKCPGAEVVNVGFFDFPISLPKPPLDSWVGGLIVGKGPVTTYLLSYASFPAYNNAGERNGYCPLCAQPLIAECQRCRRQIGSGEQNFCTGCGERIWPSVTPSLLPQSVPDSGRLSG